MPGNKTSAGPSRSATPSAEQIMGGKKIENIPKNNGSVMDEIAGLLMEEPGTEITTTSATLSNPEQAAEVGTPLGPETAAEKINKDEAAGLAYEALKNNREVVKTAFNDARANLGDSYARAFIEANSNEFTATS